MKKGIKIEDLSDEVPMNIQLGLNFDDPTSEETVDHQEMAMQMQADQTTNELYNEHVIRGGAQELLSYIHNINTNRQRVGWLRRVGYTHACVPGGKMPLDIAPTRNVAAMYKTEVESQRKLASQ